MQNYVSVHVGREDTVGDGLTRRLYDGGPFITTVKVGDGLTLTLEPRELRRLAEDLLVVADKAVRRQDEQEHGDPLFEAAS